ncbi:protein saal1 [Anguilla anguilla]|uniref:protein saal1 n=1 Tax=Anguilla anguilla TaxID=7936 RepID=UPI0015A8C328|nr:protein saal1 [Anguilla anguilla]
MEASSDAEEVKVVTESSSPDSDGYPHSPGMDRNPSPPPSQGSEPEVESDSIGETLYSKHWLFSTLTSLIQTVTEQEAGDPDAEVDLSEEEEEKLCKIWDMAMDKDVAGLLQEFKASDILLGAIAKSRSPRLTEICVGILGNMACFPETCLSISQNEDLGVVLLLLLGDSDPPTILETSRLLLTCLAQSSVAPIWLERVQQQASVCPSLCFIMCSSTNVDLLVKVGELVHKLFDLDEELMKSWVSARPSEADTGSQLHIAPSLLEAAKQVRLESTEGLEVYLHVLQLLTTVDEGVQALVELAGTGEEVWAALCEVVCEDLCQPDDPPVVLQEQKGRLAPALAVLSTLSACPDQEYSQTHRNLPLLGTLLRVLQFLSECQQRAREGQGEASSGNGLKEENDEQMLALRETTVEFLASMLTDMTKDAMSELLKKGHLSEQTCLAAAGSLLPDHRSEVQHMAALLSEAQSSLADALRRNFPDLSS